MVLIVTKPGKLTADEACAVALLKILYEEDPPIVTADPDMFHKVAPEEKTFSLGVGRTYDPDNGAYDITGLTFEGYFPNVPLALTGIIWTDYGEEIAKQMGSKSPETVHRYAYKYFMSTIDASANNVPYLKSAGLPVNYPQALSLPFCLEQMRDNVSTAQAIIKSYLEKLVEKENTYYDELDGLETCYMEAFEAGSEIMVLDRKYETVGRFLRKTDPGQFIKFIVCPRTETQWNLWTVDYGHKKYNTYVPIITNYDDDRIKFVHKKQFIAVASDQESAIELAQASLGVYYRASNYVSRIWRWWTV